MEQAHKTTTPDILIRCGAFLIVVAIFVLASSGWQSFSPTGRIITSLLPLVALYALGFATRNNEQHRSLSRVTILAGSIVFPLVAGIVAYQSNLYTTVDATMVFGVSLLSLVWYAFLEFALNERWHAVGTLVASVTMAISFGEIIDASNWAYAVMGIILAYFYLDISRNYAARESDPEDLAVTYAYAGVAVGVTSLLTFPLFLVQSLGNGEWANTTAILIYVAEAVALLPLAITYSKLWQAGKSPLDLFLRRTVELTSSIAFTVPALTVAVVANQTSDLLLVLLLGVLAVVAGSFIRIGMLRFLGISTLTVALLRILFLAFTQVGAAWPILMLVIGFLLIAAAYIGQREGYQRIAGNLMRLPSEERSWYGLGVDPVVPHHSGDGGNLGGSSHSSNQNEPSVLWLLAILVFILMIARYIL